MNWVSCNETLLKPFQTEEKRSESGYTPKFEQPDDEQLPHDALKIIDFKLSFSNHLHFNLFPSKIWKLISPEK